MSTQILPIEVFYWATPNGHKITITLEEIGVPYTVTFVNIGEDEQWSEAFGSLSPNHQIPAIRDPEGPGGRPITVFESGAILLYLGRKFGLLYPRDDELLRIAVEEWLIWQVAYVGPFLGQTHHFNFAAPEEVPYAIERYAGFARRIYAVLNERLGARDYVAADQYTIADIAIFCWVSRHERQRIDLADYPNVRAWFERIAARPAVVRGRAVVKPGHVSTASLTPAWAARPASSA